MNESSSRHGAPAKQSGFTLAELLLATTIAATLSVAIIGLLAGGVRTWQRLSTSPEQTEVQRALLAMGTDVRQAVELTVSSNSLELRLTGGARVRYRVVAENGQRWLVREVLNSRGHWTWEPKWPLFRIPLGTLELSAKRVSGKEQLTLKTGQINWTVRIVPRVTL